MEEITFMTTFGYIRSWASKIFGTVCLQIGSIIEEKMIEGGGSVFFFTMSVHLVSRQFEFVVP